MFAGAVELSPEGEPRRIRLVADRGRPASPTRRRVPSLPGPCAPRAGDYRRAVIAACPTMGDHQPKVRCNARPSVLWQSCVLSLPAWVARNLPCVLRRAHLPAATWTSSCSAGTAAVPHSQRLSTPRLQHRARACDPPPTARSSQHVFPHCQPSYFRPPRKAPSIGANTGPPSLPDSTEANFLKSKKLRPDDALR